MLRTLEIFFTKPTKEQYLLDIARSIKLSHTSVKKNLIELVKSGVLSEKTERKGRRKFPLYRAQTDNAAFRRYKKIYNLSSIMESGLVEFIEERLSPKAIVLFGSYRRGEDTESSDIDLFVECKKEELDTEKFEKKLCRKIELHFRESFTLYPKELKNNIINGIVLSGFLEGYK